MHYILNLELIELVLIHRVSLILVFACLFTSISRRCRCTFIFVALTALVSGVVAVVQFVVVVVASPEVVLEPLFPQVEFFDFAGSAFLIAVV